MQIDMHYYGTYCLARTAGLTQEASRIIATSAQFVDDNANESEIDLKDASACLVHATAHHTANIANISPDDQRQVWVPFHFLPGNKGSSFTERLICRKDSDIAREMCNHHMKQDEKPYYLELLGVMAHVYADTFAHYGFSGVSSRKNRVDNDSFEFRDLNNNIRKYIIDKKKSFFAKFNPLIQNIKSQLAENLSGALGHGAVVTFPDRPYLEWKFTYEDGHESGWRDNTQTFLDYCNHLHERLCTVANDHPEFADLPQQQSWTQLEPKIRKILSFQAKGEKRIARWKNEAKSGDLFNQPEVIPRYKDWNDGFKRLEKQSSKKVMDHPIYKYYQAASYHRWYVLRELLPEHNLLVA